MFVGDGVGAYQAGEVWHALDTRFGMTPTMIRQSQVGRIPLNRYSVIIMPSGNYREMGESSLTKLKTWIEEGGTLVSLGSADRFRVSIDSGRVFQRTRPAKTPRKPKKSCRSCDHSERPRDELALDSIGGAIFESDVDRDSSAVFWIS